MIAVQWTIIITNSLGPVKLLCYIEIVLYLVCKNNKIQRNFELWDQENYFVISGFCYISVFFITKVHCNMIVMFNDFIVYSCSFGSFNFEGAVHIEHNAVSQWLGIWVKRRNNINLQTQSIASTCIWNKVWSNSYLHVVLQDLIVH